MLDLVRPTSPIAARLLAAVTAAVAALIGASGAAAHEGHAHGVPVGPPAPAFAWGADPAAEQKSRSAREAYAARAFDLRLQQAPLEVGERCLETVEFPAIGEGCRTDDGLLRIQQGDGHSMTTHGPDPTPTWFVQSSTMPTYLVAALSGAGPDDIHCVDADQPHVALVYAMAGDGRDRSAIVPDIMRRSIYEASAAIDATTRHLAPPQSRRIKVLCDGDGEPVVRVLRLPVRTADATFERIVSLVRTRVADTYVGSTGRPVIFWDAHLGDFGGLGQIRDDDRNVANNDNNLGGQATLLDGSDSDLPDWKTMLHEISHNMGAVQQGMPDSNEVYHCNSGLDIMCYAEPETDGVVGTYDPDVCPELVYDCGSDTYFHPTPDAGTPLAERWNVASPLNRYLHAATVPADVTAPTAPGTVQASGHGRFVRLTWTAASDAGSGVAGYRVRRKDGDSWVSVGDATASATTLDVTWQGFPAQTDVVLRLTAFDARGNESTPVQVTADTASIDGTLPAAEGPPLAPPTNVHVASATSTSVTLRWTRVDGDPEAHTLIERDGWWWTRSGEEVTFTGLQPGTRYEFELTTRDGPTQYYATVGRRSSTVVIEGWTTGASSTAPAAPADLRVESSVEATPTLAWSASSGATSYVVARKVGASWEPITTTASTSSAATGLAYGTTHTLGVAARNAKGALSAYSTVSFAAGAAPDSTAPSAPVITSVTWPSDRSVQLSWMPATDNVGVVEYQVMVARDADLFFRVDSTTTATVALVSDLLPATRYRLRVDALDAAGNRSTYYGYHWVQPSGESNAPQDPTELEALDETATTVTLRWQPAVDDGGIAGYKVYRRSGGSWLHLDTTVETSYLATGLAPETSYEFKVVARDTSGNDSPGAATVTATTTALVAPSAPAQVWEGDSVELDLDDAVAGTSILVGWSEADPGSREIDHYEWCVRAAPDCGGSGVSGSTADAWTFGAVAALPFGISGTHTTCVRAVDVAGLAGAYACSDGVAVTEDPAHLPDTTPPSDPIDLAGTALSPTSVRLTWTAAIDDVEIGSYQVFRWDADIASWIKLADITATTYDVTGLEPDSSTWFSVMARDTSDNYSPGNEMVQVSTPAATPPAAPAAVWEGSGAASDIDTVQEGTSVSIGWSSATAGTYAIASYEWCVRTSANCVGSGPSGTTSVGAPRTASVTLAAGSWVTCVRAVDVKGSAGAYRCSDGITVRAPDLTPPTMPATLTASSTTTTSVHLSWSPSTDDVGPVRYRVLRWQPGDAEWTTVTELTGTSHTVTGLTAGTYYWFGVVALDGANRMSGVQTVELTTSAPPQPQPQPPVEPAPVEPAPEPAVEQPVVDDGGSSSEDEAEREQRDVPPVRLGSVRLPAVVMGAKQLPIVTVQSTGVATAVLRVEQQVRGYRAGRRCVARPPRGVRRPKRCTLVVKVPGTGRAKLTAGRNTVALPRAIVRRLKPGPYTLVVTAKDTAGRSVVKRARFTVRPAPRRKPDKRTITLPSKAAARS